MLQVIYSLLVLYLVAIIVTALALMAKKIKLTLGFSDVPPSICFVGFTRYSELTVCFLPLKFPRINQCYEFLSLGE